MDRFFECVACNTQFRVTGSKGKTTYFCPDCGEDQLEMFQIWGIEALKNRLRVYFGLWGKADVTIWGRFHDSDY